MKKVKIILTSLVMSMLLCMTAFAGQWMSDNNGWWYQNTDGSYLTDGWYWINGNCYYFGSDGYAYSDETTPDGYTVNADGAWIIDGALQTWETEVTIGAATVTVPNGYDIDADYEADAVSFDETNGFAGTLVMSVHEAGINDIREALGDEGLQAMSDAIVPEILTEISQDTVFQSKSTEQYANGTWYHYVYQVTVDGGITFQCHMYVSYVGDAVRIVATVGNNREFSESQFVSDYIR